MSRFFKYWTPLTLCCVLLLTASSCKRARLNRETTSTEDYIRIQYAWNDIIRQAQGGLEIALADSNIAWNRCATITKDSINTVFPFNFTMDFGLTNCIDSDGRQRRGRLICEISDEWNKEGATLSITSEGYHLSNFSLEGDAEITYDGINAASKPSFSVVISDASISSDGKPTITWESTQGRVMEEGFETVGFTINPEDSTFLGSSAQLDDVYIYDESASGINADGRSYTLETVEPVRYELECRYVVSGRVELVPEALKKRDVYFGNGNCDDEVLVTIDDEEYAVEIQD